VHRLLSEVAQLGVKVAILYSAHDSRGIAYAHRYATVHVCAAFPSSTIGLGALTSLAPDLHAMHSPTCIAYCDEWFSGMPTTAKDWCIDLAAC
jgi:hypothetical protein